MSKLKKSFLLIILSKLFLPTFLEAQEIAGTEKDEINLSTDQIVGFSSIGLGAATLIYASRGHDELSTSRSNKKLEYVIGGTLVAAGIGFLIFGNKDEGKTKYWKGMSDNYNKNQNYFPKFGLHFPPEKKCIQNHPFVFKNDFK